MDRESSTETNQLSEWPDIASLPRSYLSEHQQEQLHIATRGKIGMLSGLAGTGKTTALAYLLRNLPPSAEVAIIGPTGKAAVRAGEVLAEKGITNVVTATAHRLLLPNRTGYDGKGWSFEYNEYNTLPFDVVIVDEAPMLSAELMASILRAIGYGTLVLLQGDTEQLPPIGHGRPYLDMMRAGLPHGMLTEVWRNAGRIADVCNLIRQGKDWEASEKFDLDADYPENYRHLEVRNQAGVLQLMQRAIFQMADRGFDPFTDSQVICPLREKGQLSTVMLNKYLQPLLNPNGRQINGISFRIGDKVLCTHNKSRDEELTVDKYKRLNKNYEKGIQLTEAEQQFMDEAASGINDFYGMCEAMDDCPSFVANGEMGVIEDIDDGDMIVKFPGRENSIVFPYDDWKKNIDLAYATTCHKMQGSQSPLAISIVDSSHSASYVCSRAYHYTANSRAQKALITIGRKATITEHCKRVDVHNRETRLTEEIKSWHDPQNQSDLDSILARLV